MSAVHSAGQPTGMHVSFPNLQCREAGRGMNDVRRMRHVQGTPFSSDHVRPPPSPFFRGQGSYAAKVKRTRFMREQRVEGATSNQWNSSCPVTGHRPSVLRCHIMKRHSILPPPCPRERRLAMMPTSNVFKKGHSLELIIRNQDDLLGRLGTWGVYMLPFMQTVTHQIHFGESHLLLPVISPHGG